MSHNELKQTEPQVRMLLNCAWEAIEHVGWDLHSLRNSPTGVFIGAQVPAVSNWRPQHGVTEYSVSGISLAMLANRISYHFNLMGSSATCCTACSAGLSALHAAMNAPACGDCEQALVGAVTYLGSGRMSSSFNLMGVISPEGTCHSFDAEANGYMRSEGSFVFAIKPLAAAERDGDPIYAVIEATAVNAALGVLFKAGVPLDFAAQYPRPMPIVHLLPGHPRDEQKSVDNTLDDEFLQKRSEYSHEPLVGHRVPCDHLLLEARLSERSVPWLAEHRVHHAPIMHAAGYIELVLQALEGAPVHIEKLEFLQPCPIPRTPVRLQPALQPVSNSPDEFTLTISTQPYDVDAKSELHCRGQVRLVGADHAPSVPGHLTDIDSSRYEPLAYAADDELYERFETVLGETFQCGPYFRNMRRLRRDVATDYLLFDVEVDEGLWKSGQEEGYVSFPALLDGGLQSFLYDLMLGADLFAIPRRAEGVTFLRAPTVPRLACHVTYPGNIRYEVDDKGQYSVPTGEWVSGSISCYDGVTGDLVLHIEKYFSFISNPRRVDLPYSKHRSAWQPKFVSDGPAIAGRLPEGEIEPSALLVRRRLAFIQSWCPRLCALCQTATRRGLAKAGRGSNPPRRRREGDRHVEEPCRDPAGCSGAGGGHRLRRLRLYPERRRHGERLRGERRVQPR